VIDSTVEYARNLPVVELIWSWPFGWPSPLWHEHGHSACHMKQRKGAGSGSILLCWSCELQKFTRDYQHSTVTVFCHSKAYADCDGPNLLQFSLDAIVLFSHFGKGDWFIGETDLVTSYDLFLVSGQKTTALVFFLSPPSSVWMSGR
jgi:hypothetical protein